MSLEISDNREYSFKSSTGVDILGGDSANGSEIITSAFGSSTPTSSNLLSEQVSVATPASLTSDFVDYHSIGSGNESSLKGYKKVFTSSTTKTKSTKYGSNESLPKAEPLAMAAPTPARSSSSMSKLEVEQHKHGHDCSHDHGPPVKQQRPSSGASRGAVEAKYSYSLERTSTSSSPSKSRNTLPNTARKVKFSDQNREIEFSKDIDSLPDPELEKDISLYSLEKTTSRNQRRVKMDLDEKFDYNDFALIPPHAARSPLMQRKNDVRHRSPSPSIDPRTPSPIHQLSLPVPPVNVRTPSPKEKAEQHSEHNCKYHSHHLDYKYTPPPVKGPCIACGQYIVGSLVTALDQMWHPECFTCVNCDTILKSHNYMVEDGKQYCKDCHLRLFGPPCSVCHKPTKNNRYNLLNRIWHPECFCCVECGKRLTPDNFIERLGSPYCKEDYHRLFSPKCCVCHLPIKDKAINALGKMWHPQCFKCTHCGIPLEERNFYEKNGLPYCEKDYMDLFNPKCWGCKKPIVDGRQVMAMGHPWHPECFRCTVCVKPLSPDNFKEHDGKPYCDKDYHNLFSPKCAGCKLPITDDNPLKAMGRNYHPQCFKCTECAKPLSPYNFFERNGLPYCEDDYHRLFSPKCAGCKQPIKDNNFLRAMGKDWHPQCFQCDKCRVPLKPDNFYEVNGRPYCEDDYNKLFLPKCCACAKPIKGKPLRALGKDWHPECFKCDKCDKTLSPDNFYEMNGKPYCEDDYNNLFLPKCCACTKPIKGKPLFACGKEWHPECFKCHECHIPLSPNHFFEKDGWPYCENDYNRLFMPKCCACQKPIKGRVLRAMGKNWHPECFQCDKCHVQLSPDNFYERDGRPYCEDDFHKLFSPKCCACHKPIKERPLIALGKEWHPHCFVCSHPRCGKVLDANDFAEHGGKPYCRDHYNELFLPKCFACHKPITDKVVSALGKTWHPECFACVQCNKPLDLNSFRERDGLPYCEADYHALFSPKCAACEAPIIEKCLTALGKTWHPEHFTCQHCNKVMADDPEGYHEHDGKGYCRPCYIELFAPYCRGCNKPIVDKICVTALNSKYHTDCFVCRDCSCPLKNGNYFEFEGEPYCEDHFRCKMCPDCVKLRRAQNKYFGQQQKSAANGGVPSGVVGTHQHHQNQIRLGA